MTNEEILKKIPKPKSKDYKLDQITEVNHKPHPYCITEKHLRGDHMYLNEATIKEAEEKHGAHCGMYTSPDGKNTYNGFRHGWTKCEIPYDEHTSEKALFIQALVDKEVKDLENLQEYLKSIVPIMEKYKVAGAGFLAPDKTNDTK